MSKLLTEPVARHPSPASMTPPSPGRAPAPSEPRPTGSLKVFWAVCLITIVMSHYAIAARLNLPYKAMTLLAVAAAPLTTGFFNLLSNRAVIWLLVYEAVLVLGCLTRYTGNPSDLFNVHSAPVVMVRVFPFMLCGYTLAQFPRQEKHWLLRLVVLFTLVTFPDAITFARGSLQGQSRDRLLTSSFDYESANAILSGYVNLTICCLIIAILANRLRGVISQGQRWFVFVCQSVLASICVTAGFTAAALLLLVAIVLTGLTAPVRTLRFRVLALLTAIVFIAGAWAVFGMVAEDTGGTFAQVYKRLDGLRKTIVSGEITADTSKSTSGRLDLGMISIRSFLKSPMIGLGKGELSQTIKGHISDTIGGHSYILDSLGQRGLLGTFPLLVVLGSFVMTAYRNFRKASGSWREAATLTIMPMWIIAMIINPYFLGYLALNCVVFLCFGLILGDAVRLRNTENNRKIFGVAHALSR
jgi:hypothetical protein